MIAIFALCGIIMNANENDEEQWNEDTTPTSLIGLTMGSRGVFKNRYDSTEMIVQIYLNFFCIFVIVILINLLRWRQLVIEKQIDEKNITPSDFTVYAMNLPLDKDQKEVKEFFESVKNKNWIVSKVNFCYDIKDIVSKLEELEKWNKKRNYNSHKVKELMKEHKITKEEAIKKVADYEKVKSAALKVAEQIEAIKKEINEKDDSEIYTGNAFITFETQGMAFKCEDKFDMWYLTKAVSFVWYSIFKCKQAKGKNTYWKGKRVIVERATEPGDVYWENLSVKDFERVMRQCLTYFITILCLGCAFGIYYGLNQLNRFLNDKANEDDAPSYYIWLVRLVNIVISTITVIINIVLDRIIRRLSKLEKHRTYTNYHLSVALKLMIATFVNTSMLPLFNNLKRKDWFTNNGLAMTIFFNTLSVSFVSPLFYFFSIPYFIKKIRI